MNFTSLTPTESQVLEQKFLADAQRILEMQNEINELQKQLDEAMEHAEQHEFSLGHKVDFQSVLPLKQIAFGIAPKRKALKRAMKTLYWDLFPGDFFIDQHFYQTWVSLKPHWVMRFSYDMESIEMRKEEELN